MPLSLRRRSDFDRVLSTGRHRRVGGITIVVAPGEPETTRIGLIAGRKVGKAVERNRAKRRIRHAIRQAELTPGRDYVVIAGPRVVDAPFDQLVSWIRRGVDT